MQQTWDTENYACHGRFVAELAAPLVEMLQPREGERILDLGCGDGFLTRTIVESGASVLAVDSSPHMVDAARGRKLDAQCMNAETIAFENEFDAVFSNAALHWMPDQNAVLGNVYRALKPGGRFVAEMGGQGNIAAIRVALMAVLVPRGIAVEHIETNYFFNVDEYRARLESKGFHVEHIALIPRPTVLPSGIAGWLETFRSDLLGKLPREERATVVEEVAALLKPVLCDREATWIADYVRLRFMAHRPIRD